MDDSTRSPRCVPRLAARSPEGQPPIDRSPGEASRPRLSSWLFRGMLFLFGPASVFGAIPVGPFCGDTTQSALMQNGSLTADGIASACGVDKTCPGSSGPNVPYVANSFTNDTGADVCVTVSGSNTCTDTSAIGMAAYLGSFDPTNICTNYVADPGAAVTAGGTADFSFVVPNGATFVVVASSSSPGNDCGTFCFTLDAVACSITCPDNITAGTGAGATECGTNITWDIGLPCGGAPSCTVDGGTPVASGDFFPVGTTTVTCTGAGAQCSFDVTVNDTTPPALTCPGATSSSANGNCQGTVPNVLANVTVADNCSSSGNIQLSQSPTAGSLVGIGKTTITVTATDEAGNQSQCTTDFTVVDSTAPQITCPANIDVIPEGSACGATVNYTVPTANDTCSPATVVCAPASGTFFPAGATTVTCTATDQSNNQSQCTFTITVHANDTTPPTITCPADVVAFTDPNGTEKTVHYPAPEASDTCSKATVQCSPASGSTFPVGDTQVTCTATDASQNTSQCSFTVSVRPSPVVPTLDPCALAGLAAALAAAGAVLARKR